MTDSNGFTKLDSTEESFIAIGFFFLCPIGMVLTCQIAVLLAIKLKQNQIKIKTACYWAIISLICGSISLLSNTLLANDLIFKFNFSDPNSRYTSFVDVIATTSYGLGKISFYFAFTYHILSIFSNENDRKTVKFLKVWMIIIGLLDLIIILVVCIDDSTNNPSKETGITSPHNIYISMIDGHEGAPYAKVALVVAILGDIIYFLVLISIYIKKLKYLHRNHKVSDKKYLDIGTKGVTLVTFSCIMFCIFFMMLIIDLPTKYWGAPFIVTDAIGLYLMFQVNDALYQNLCGTFHNCWKSMLYGDGVVEFTELGIQEYQDDDTQQGNESHAV